jgi:hypothetical protein
LTTFGVSKEYCQAQLQLAISLEIELYYHCSLRPDRTSPDPTSHDPANHPEKYQNSSLQRNLLSNICYTCFTRPKSVKFGRRPQYFGKWKTTSIFWQMEDNLNIWVNGRRPHDFGKWKTTSLFWQMEDNLNIMANWRRPQ